MNLLGIIVSTYLALLPASVTYGGTPSALICIAQHESHLEQFTPSGSVVMSPTHDFGLFQINQVWIPLSKEMGLDIIGSAKDNATFAVWLANTHGLTQWTTYKYCDGSSG